MDLPSVGGVLVQVAVWGAPRSVLRRVRLALPRGLLLAPHAVGASQVGQALGRRPLVRRVLGAAAVSSLRAGLLEVVAQVLQVQSPGAELLPVHPLEGHDAVQVAAHLRSPQSR